MDTDGTAFAAVAETTSFLHYFSELPDHRQAGKVDYPLPEVLLLILLDYGDRITVTVHLIDHQFSALSPDYAFALRATDRSANPPYGFRPRRC